MVLYKVRLDATLDIMQIVILDPLPFYVAVVSAANHLLGGHTASVFFCTHLLVKGCHCQLVENLFDQSCHFQLWELYMRKEQEWANHQNYFWQQYLWKAGTGVGSHIASAFDTNIWRRDVYYAIFVTLAGTKNCHVCLHSKLHLSSVDNFTFVHTSKLPFSKLFAYKPHRPSLVQILSSHLPPLLFFSPFPKVQLFYWQVQV